MDKSVDASTANPRAQRGFTLLEILITLVIIALGVLGAASMQALALKLAQGGLLRTQAVVLGLDVLERIEANNPGAVTGSYAATILPGSSTKDCNADYCLAGELATFDLVQFKSQIEAQLPGASATITFAGAGPFTYTVQITWVERIGKSSQTTVATSGTTTVSGAGKTETFSYTVSKIIYDRSALV